MEFEETPEEIAAREKRSRAAARMARDTVLQSAADRFVKTVYASAPSPEIGHLAAEVLLDTAMMKVDVCGM